MRRKFIIFFILVAMFSCSQQVKSELEENSVYFKDFDFFEQKGISLSEKREANIVVQYKKNKSKEVKEIFGRGVFKNLYMKNISDLPKVYATNFFDSERFYSSGFDNDYVIFNSLDTTIFIKFIFRYKGDTIPNIITFWCCTKVHENEILINTYEIPSHKIQKEEIVLNSFIQNNIKSTTQKYFWTQKTRLKLKEGNILISNMSMPGTENSSKSIRINPLKNEAFFLTIMGNLIDITMMF